MYFVQVGIRNGKKVTTKNIERISKHSELLKQGHKDPLAYEKKYVENYNSIIKEDKIDIKLSVDLSEKLKNNGNDVCAFDIEETTNKYEEIISIGKKEHEDNSPSKYYRDGFNLHKRLDEFKEETLKFLKDPSLPYTNNLIERLLRTIKMKYKTTCGFRSDESVGYFLDTRSFIETARIKNENIYQSIKDTFASEYK